MSDAAKGRQFIFETLNISQEGGVLFAEINAPPMNLLGPELVRDLVSLIERAEADDAVRVLVFRAPIGACPQRPEADRGGTQARVPDA